MDTNGENQLEIFIQNIELYEKGCVDPKIINYAFSTISLYLSGVKGYFYNNMLLIDLYKEYNLYMDSLIKTKKFIIEYYNNYNKNNNDINNVAKDKHWLVNKSIYVNNGIVKFFSVINQRVPKTLYVEVLDSINSSSKNTADCFQDSKFAFKVENNEI